MCVFRNSSHAVSDTELRTMTITDEKFREITECLFLQHPSRQGSTIKKPTHDNFFVSEVQESCLLQYHFNWLYPFQPYLLTYLLHGAESILRS